MGEDTRERNDGREREWERGNTHTDRERKGRSQAPRCLSGVGDRRGLHTFTFHIYLGLGTSNRVLSQDFAA